ncbi:hypothetical protein MMU07_17395 [Aquiflexum sp. LQ15W]|uniref:hypothetical protein n=1 Tax=Cognataquiflexum nitidum TaxID=2922272 RepID=UPI001F140DD3|nr:hypothetical protein [Cognataquiflexum nitidum]MCH6201362.1 hypothetical protein [Cognataquiflexum nitidum]
MFGVLACGVPACGVRGSLYFRSEQELGTWYFEQFLEQSTRLFGVLACGVRACGVRGEAYIQLINEL